MSKQVKFTKRHPSICIEEGFRTAFIENGNLIAMFPGNGDEHDDEMIVQAYGAVFKAWVLTGPRGMRSPKSITRPNSSGGASPAYRFKTVREAARLAFNNPHY